MISEAEKNFCTQLIERENEKKKKDDDKFSSMSNVNDDLLPDMHLCGGIKLEKKSGNLQQTCLSSFPLINRRNILPICS